MTRHFLAGLIEHAPAMMVFFNPTVNAYRRINAEALVPTRASWGHDHRMTLVRVPKERGIGHPRWSCASATAPPARTWPTRRRWPPAWTASAASWSRRAPIEGMIYDLPEDVQGAALPTTFADALDALRADSVIYDALGPA